MKANQIRVKIKSRKGILPYGSINMTIDKKHLEKLLGYIIGIKAEEEKSS